jgi:hypothetical protein
LTNSNIYVLTGRKVLPFIFNKWIE